MLSSICPLGERARNRPWLQTTVAYLLGSLLGGLVLGALASLLGSAIPDQVRGSTPALLSLAVAFLVGLILDLRSRGSVPSWHRQVDEVWLTTYRGWVYGLGFGTQLGFGLVTIVTSTTTYAAVLLAALSGHLGAGLLIGGTFGLVRALPSVLMRGVHTRPQLNAVFRDLEKWAPRADVLARVTLITACVLLVAAALAPTLPEV